MLWAWPWVTEAGNGQLCSGKNHDQRHENHQDMIELTITILFRSTATMLAQVFSLRQFLGQTIDKGRFLNTQHACPAQRQARPQILSIQNVTIVMSFRQVRLKYLGSQRYRIDFQVRIQTIQTGPEQSNKTKQDQNRPNTAKFYPIWICPISTKPNPQQILNQLKPSGNEWQTDSHKPIKTIEINQLRDQSSKLQQKQKLDRS